MMTMMMMTTKQMTMKKVDFRYFECLASYYWTDSVDHLVNFNLLLFVPLEKTEAEDEKDDDEKDDDEKDDDEEEVANEESELEILSETLGLTRSKKH